MKTLLTTQELHLRMQERVLVHSLDLNVRAGEVWAVIGPNGAGKSTLLRTLAGLRDVDGGEVSLDGKPLSRYSPKTLARRRGFLPQAVTDAFSLTVRDAVASARYPHLSFWHWGDEDDEPTREALATFELDALADRDITTLSGGERQRVNIAAIFAQDVDVLLLDEPLSSLDLHQQMRVLQELERTAVRDERAVIYSVHDINLAIRHATHAILLDGNGTALAGPMLDVVTGDNLSAAFRHPIHGVDIDGERFFRAGRLTNPKP